MFGRHHWPGNIRELQNVVRVALALCGEDEATITPQHLPEDFLAAATNSAAPGLAGPATPHVPGVAAARQPTAAGEGEERESLAAIERQAIARLLDECGGNLSAAARRLGISRNTLYRKLGRARRPR